MKAMNCLGLVLFLLPAPVFGSEVVTLEASGKCRPQLTAKAVTGSPKVPTSASIRGVEPETERLEFQNGAEPVLRKKPGEKNQD